MFPFGRGLCHDYWAPNAWALYATADKALRPLCVALGRAVDATSPWCAGPQGIVGTPVATFSALPSVTPGVCALLCAAGVAVGVVPALWRRCGPGTSLDPVAITNGVVACTLLGFLFGWHVHEKALLVPAMLSGYVQAPPWTPVCTTRWLPLVSAYYPRPLCPLSLTSRECSVTCRCFPPPPRVSPEPWH